METPSVFALAKRSAWVWLGIMLTGGGSLLLLIGSTMLWEEWAYHAHGRLAQGTVLAKEVRPIRGTSRSRDYYVRYRFTNADGHSVENESHVSRERWQQLKESQRVPIEYLPDWRTSRIGGETEGMVPHCLPLWAG